MSATALREEAERIAGEMPAVAKPYPSLAAALVAALADVCIIEKSETVSTGSYSYDYASLPATVKVSRPELAKHGIVALQDIHAHGDGLACTTILLHESGEVLRFAPFPFPMGKDAQATGSWVTYIRRYDLLAALGIAPDKDDDGAGAAPRRSSTPNPHAAIHADLAALPVEVRDRLVADAEARSGGDLAGVLADDGWRKWLTDAIAAHKGEPAPASGDEKA